MTLNLFVLGQYSGTARNNGVGTVETGQPTLGPDFSVVQLASLGALFNCVTPLRALGPISCWPQVPMPLCPCNTVE